MIYTVTFNPSIDCYINIDSLNEGQMNRASEEYTVYAGKGINVARVLASLGHECTCLGFVAGSNGAAIEDGLKGICITDFIHLKEGNSRINVKLSTADKETEINAPGPVIDKGSYEELKDKLKSLTSSDLVIFSGSVPPGLSKNPYEELTCILKDSEVPFALDCTGKLFLGALKNGPMVVKPNVDELAEMFNTVIETNDLDSVFEYAKKIKDMGAKEVIVSLGKDGALFLDERGELTLFTAYKGEVVSTVCAGDSLLAGFIAGKKKGLSSASALELGVAAGSACAFSRELPSAEAIYKLLGRQY